MFMPKHKSSFVTSKLPKLRFKSIFPKTNVQDRFQLRCQIFKFILLGKIMTNIASGISKSTT